MKIVIDIPKEYYDCLKNMNDKTMSLDALAIKYGTPLPEGHGRLIDTDYVINHICESKECYKENCKGKQFMRCPDIMWIDDAPTVLEADGSEEE